MDFSSQINGLSLFSGIGGIDVALRDYVKTIAYCEIEPYCQAVLLSRMASGDLDNAPIWDDIRSFNGLELPKIDIIFGGFPCQDISVAGLGKGLEGERSGLFFEILRLAKEIKPPFIFLENVPAITTRGGLRVVREIAEAGYDCRWCIISAASVGALHRRERWFLLAHSKHYGTSAGIPTDVANDSNANSQPSREADSQAVSEQAERGAWRRLTGQCWPFESREHWKKTVSEMDKCTNGIPNNMERLKSLGNAVVPAQAKKAFEILMGLRYSLYYP